MNLWVSQSNLLVYNHNRPFIPQLPDMSFKLIFRNLSRVSKCAGVHPPQYVCSPEAAIYPAL